MRPVYQTIRSLPGANCVQASTASLLNLPLDAVPNFMLAGHPQWFHDWMAWLADRGFQVLQHGPGWTPQGLYIAMGPAGSDVADHAVVMRGGKLVHDPEGPSARGLRRVDFVYALLPLDPAP